MGKIAAITIDKGFISICGKDITYPESIRTELDLERVDGRVRITLMLPRKGSNDNYLDEFRLLIDVTVDTKSEEANSLCYKLLAELKEEFQEISKIKRLIVPT